jgi:hypothetical protein
MNGTTNLKLDNGIQQLEDWAGTAHQTHKNHLYKALFAITDGSVANHYVVLEDKENTHARFVLVREDLVLKVNYPTPDSFNIDYIGPMDDAPGITRALQAL